MSGLDRIRVPENRRWQFTLAFAVTVFLCMMLAASWWAGAPVWRLAVAGAVSAAVGWVAAGAFLRWGWR